MQRDWTIRGCYGNWTLSLAVGPCDDDMDPEETENAEKPEPPEFPEQHFAPVVDSFFQAVNYHELLLDFDEVGANRYRFPAPQ